MHILSAFATAFFFSLYFEILSFFCLLSGYCYCLVYDSIFREVPVLRHHFVVIFVVVWM